MALQKCVTCFLLWSSIFLLSCAKPADSGISETANQYDWNSGTDNGIGECDHTSKNSYSAGIVGGEAVHNNNWLAKGIVLLVQTSKNDKGQSQTSMCTASLIGADIILTAAHCVDKSVQEPSNLNVYFTPQPQCEQEQGRLEKVKQSVMQIKVHPNWRMEDENVANRGDIALVRLKKSAPLTYKPLKIASDFISLSESSPILVAGFGMTNPNYNGNFGGPVALRATQVSGLSQNQKTFLLQLIQNDPSELAIYENEFNNLSTNEMLYIDQSQGRGICSGDSGGPSFMKTAEGEDVIAGVASFVMNPSNPKLLCGFIGAHTNVFYYKNWIFQTLQELKEISQ